VVLSHRAHGGEFLRVLPDSRSRTKAGCDRFSKRDEQAEAAKLLARWRIVLEDEKQNTEQARPVMARDMRLDYHYGGDHVFSHGVDVLDAKLQVLAAGIE